LYLAAVVVTAGFFNQPIKNNGKAIVLFVPENLIL
jgi:hypothetical protein